MPRSARSDGNDNTRKADVGLLHVIARRTTKRRVLFTKRDLSTESGMPISVVRDRLIRLCRKGLVVAHRRFADDGACEASEFELAISRDEALRVTP